MKKSLKKYLKCSSQLIYNTTNMTIKHLVIIIPLLFMFLIPEGILAQGSNAPVPLTPSVNILNFYSDAFVNPVSVSNWAINGNVTYTEVNSNGNYYLKYVFEAGKFLVQTANFTSIDVSAKNYLHIDIYTPNAASLGITIIDGSSPNQHQFQVQCATPTLNKWLSYDIPLSLFTNNGVDLTNLKALQFIVGNNANLAGTSISIDNIYFSTTANFFLKNGGSVTSISSWGTNSDGSNLGGLGNNLLTDFVSNNINYYITNNSGISLDNDWFIGGINSKVIVGDGTNSTSFTIPSNYTIVNNCVNGITLSPSVDDISIGLLLKPAIKGLQIPTSFTGLSYESNAMVSGKYFSSTFTKHVNLIKNLGIGVIRIGANSSDNMIWNNALRNGYSGSDKIFKDDVDRFFGFATAIGWKSMFGLNVGTGTISQATDEVKYINSQSYATNLLYYELGNEPDLFHNWARIPPAFPLYPDPKSYRVSDYIVDFDAFYNSIHNTIPTAKISGSTSCCHLTDFAIPFINTEYTKLSQSTYHYYSGATSTATLLTNDATLASTTATLVNQAKSFGLPFRWSECNSVAGGLLGVSNKLASALWGADFMFTTALLGASGVNFHGGNAGAYTPIEYGNFDGINGNVRPRPLYYGILAFSLASKGTFIQNTFNTGSAINANAYSVFGTDGKYYVTIINKDVSKQAFVAIKGLPAFHNSQVIRLSTVAFGSDSATADTLALGNATTDINGNWINASSEIAGSDITGYTIKVPASSIVIVVIN